MDSLPPPIPPSSLSVWLTEDKQADLRRRSVAPVLTATVRDSPRFIIYLLFTWACVLIYKCDLALYAYIQTYLRLRSLPSQRSVSIDSNDRRDSNDRLDDISYYLFTLFSFFFFFSKLIDSLKDKNKKKGRKEKIRTLVRRAYTSVYVCVCACICACV